MSIKFYLLLLSNSVYNTHYDFLIMVFLGNLISISNNQNIFKNTFIAINHVDSEKYKMLENGKCIINYRAVLKTTLKEELT